MDISILVKSLDFVTLQSGLLNNSRAPLGSEHPIISGIVLSIFGVVGLTIILNLFNAGVRKKLVDRDKLERIMRETKSWQKERMNAFREKDVVKQTELNKKSAYMSKMNLEMMVMNMRPMLITFVPLILIFYFVLPYLFSYTVALSPIPLNVFPGNFFHLTCTAEQIDGIVCKRENEVYLWAWYFLSSISISGIIMKITKTSMSFG